MTSARDAGVTNVRFLTEDAANLGLDATVDALIGRLVLMYFANTAVVLCRLAGLVRPGGVVAFHEFNIDGPHPSRSAHSSRQ